MTIIHIIEVLTFALVGLLEDKWPLRKHVSPALPHGLKNIGMRLVQTVILFVGFSFFLKWESDWLQTHSIGLFYLIPIPMVFKIILAFLIYDGLMYGLHRANHHFPLLWRFHRVHHSDLEIDSSTAFRHHVGEAIFSIFILRMILFPVFGITFEMTLLYEVFFRAISIFHHSNIKIPLKWDRYLRLLIVSPAMHRVHHSQYRPETDSNYSHVFSFWDWLGGTMQATEDNPSIQYGLHEFKDSQWQSLTGMLKTPFISPIKTQESVIKIQN